MALTEQEINFNYTQAINKANELSAVTGDLDKAIEDLDAAITFIKNNWESNNSKTFLAKCIKEKQKIADTKQDIIKASNTIKSMADKVKEAELRALAIARAQEAARAAAAAAAAATSAGSSAVGSGAGALASAGASAVASSSPQLKNTFSKKTPIQPKNTRQPSSIPTSVLNAMKSNSSSGKSSKNKR